jgi:predicted Fe-Mo cluster-binding NifX family protein
MIDQGVELVIAGGLRREALDELKGNRLRVLVGAPSFRVEALVARFLTGTLESAPVNVCEDQEWLKYLCHTEENPPLAEAAPAINGRLRAVVASVQFARLAETPHLSPSAASDADSKLQSTAAGMSGEGATTIREPARSPAAGAVVY